MSSSDLLRCVWWCVLAGMVSACAADAPPGSQAPGVCPERAGVSPNQIDVFDGDPSEQVFLAPDNDRKGANTYTVKHIYAQGRTVTIRCHFGKDVVDVKLSKPVAVCRYSGDPRRQQMACK